MFTQFIDSPLGAIKISATARPPKIGSSRMKNAPNKAPEPTPGLVTPRAMECASEVKRRNRSRDAARGAPSPVVAHL